MARGWQCMGPEPSPTMSKFKAVLAVLPIVALTACDPPIGGTGPLPPEVLDDNYTSNFDPVPPPPPKNPTTVSNKG